MLCPQTAFTDPLSRPPTGQASRPLNSHERYSPNFPQPGVPPTELAVTLPPSTPGLLALENDPESPTSPHKLPLITYSLPSTAVAPRSPLTVSTLATRPVTGGAHRLYGKKLALPDPTLAVSTSSSVSIGKSQQALVVLPPHRLGPPPTIVYTSMGPVEGSWDEKSELYVFHGIPYAEAPIGEYRFRKPEPVEPWAAPLNCKDEHQQLQRRRVSEVVGDMAGSSQEAGEGGRRERGPRWRRSRFDSDCLYVDVWTGALGDEAALRKKPAEAPALRPVMVWLQHPILTTTDKAKYMQPDYAGTAMAQRGVVRVNLSYRTHLGAVKLEGGDFNVTFHDVMAALRWVQEEIQAFGGDKDNVTLFGDSAGAYAALVLACSPLAKGLFHKMCITSAPCHACLSEEDAAAVSETFRGIVGAEGDTVNHLDHITDQDMNAAYKDPAFLEALSNTALYAAPGFGLKTLLQDDPKGHAGVIAGLCDAVMALAVVDGEVLDAPLLDLVQGGAAKGIKMLVGYSAHECKTFMQGELSAAAMIAVVPTTRDEAEQRIATEIEGLQDTMLGLLGVSTSLEAARKLMSLYEAQSLATHPDRELDHADTLVSICSDLFSSASMLMLAERAAAADRGNVWAFRFDGYGQSGWTDGHSCILPLLHGTRMDQPLPDCKAAVGSYTWTSWITMQEAIIKTWLHFACHGDPNVKSVKFLQARPSARDSKHRGLGAKWQPYSAHMGDVMVFDAAEPCAMRATRLDGQFCMFEAENTAGLQAVQTLLETHFRILPTTKPVIG